MAIFERLFKFLFKFLATILVVEINQSHDVVVSLGELNTKCCISTICDRDGNGRMGVLEWMYKYRGQGRENHRFQVNLSFITTNWFWVFILFEKMADNIRRTMQDITLGSEDTPFVLPTEVVRQAEAENRFILIGRPVMPRKQNLRAIIATMPRNWGYDGLVRGRIIENRRFQFVFPTEEAMDTVLRRGPWAYAERMLVLQRWTPLMDMEMPNYIPFWIQIRGIPLQYMNRAVIVSVARVLGEYIQMDYNEESGSRLDFVRVRLNWNINNPLRFQRNFQFVLGVNTLLRLHYERLHGFCETCGMLTHDSG